MSKWLVLTHTITILYNSTMTDSRYAQIYIDKEYRDLLAGFANKYGGTLKKHTEDALVEYLTKRGMAREWKDGRWIWYEVDEQ